MWTWTEESCLAKWENGENAIISDDVANIIEMSLLYIDTSREAQFLGQSPCRFSSAVFQFR